MWKEDAVTFPALPETKGLNSSIEHALSLLEDSPVAEPTIVEPVRPMVKLVKLNMLTEPVAGDQTTFVDSIFCDLYCADVNKHTEHCVTRYRVLTNISICLKPIAIMFSNQTGVLHKLQRRAGGEEDAEKMGGKGKGTSNLIVQILFSSISTVINTSNLPAVFPSSPIIIVLIFLFCFK